MAGFVVASAAAPPVSAQSCSPYWTAAGAVRAGLGNLVTFDDGSGLALYSTNITLAPTVGGIGRWDGHRWSLVGTLPLYQQLFPLQIMDDGSGPGLYASGFLQSGFQFWMLRWNGQLWESLPPGLFVYPQFGLRSVPLISFNDGSGLAIYGLQCQAPSGSTCDTNSVARWTGSAWIPLGGPTTIGGVSVLGAFDLGTGPHLYALGNYQSIGGVPTAGLAMWTGSAWDNLNMGPGGYVMCQYDDGRGPALYVGGSFGVYQGQTLNGIARWDGHSWSDVGGGITSGGIAQIRGLAVFDDGRGPALYASGTFSQIGGVNAGEIARWDGHSWEPLGAGLNLGHAESFAVFDDGRGRSLFMEGNFGGFGGGSAGTASLAQWVSCPNCYANCDNSTQSPRRSVGRATIDPWPSPPTSPWTSIRPEASERCITASSRFWALHRGPGPDWIGSPWRTARAMAARFCRPRGTPPPEKEPTRPLTSPAAARRSWQRAMRTLRQGSS